jgi:uncharacterized protein VirK/YbjX
MPKSSIQRESNERQKVSLTLNGYVDSLKNNELSGWCWEKGRLDKFECELLFGGVPYQSTTANLFRTDLLSAGINDGKHGFRFDLRTFNLDALIQDDLKYLSVRVVGTDGELQSSSFIPFFKAKGARLQHGSYLANFLTEQEKIDCYNTCNKFLFRNMNESLNVPKLLWMRHFETHRISMELKHADFAPLEGELSVSVMFDGQAIYSLTFSVIRGKTVGCEEPLILFIGGLQGRPNTREKIDTSTKVSGGVHPRMLLFTAILALCDAWSISSIAAVSADQQISCNSPERLQSFCKTYDRFWRDLGGSAAHAERRIYIIPAKRNSLLRHNPQHRHRNLQRRAIRDEIQQEILRNLA